MKIYMIALTLFWGIAQNSLAVGGSHAGNGGDGVLIGKGTTKIPYLLDLVEAGVHLDPYFKNSSDYSIQVRDFLAARIGIDEEVAALAAAKMKEIDDTAPFLGFLLKSIIDSLIWNFVDQELIDVDDHGDTVLKFRDIELVQMAVRKGFSVTINKTVWRESNSANKAALIFHEAIYAIARPSKMNVKMGDTYQKAFLQRGDGARAIVGELFKKGFMVRANKSSIKTLLLKNGYDFVPEDEQFSHIVHPTKVDGGMGLSNGSRYRYDNIYPEPLTRPIYAWRIEPPAYHSGDYNMRTDRYTLNSSFEFLCISRSGAFDGTGELLIPIVDDGCQASGRDGKHGVYDQTLYNTSRQAKEVLMRKAEEYLQKHAKLYDANWVSRLE